MKTSIKYSNWFIGGFIFYFGFELAKGVDIWFDKKYGGKMKEKACELKEKINDFEIEFVKEEDEPIEEKVTEEVKDILS